jgi:hypothetical protein
MSNLVVKFSIGEAKIMWIINDNWIMLISFLLTMGTAVAYRRMKNSNKKIEIPNPKGGAFIDQCIEPGSVYELVDRPLEIVLKQMLNLPLEAGPLVISGPLLILAYIVSSQPIKQITILGVTFFVDKFRSLAVKTGVGVATGSLFVVLPLGVISLTGAILSGAIMLSVAHGIIDFECDNFVSKLPVERVSQERSIGFLERLPERTPKVFIKDSEEIELYIPSLNDVCSLEYKQSEVEKSNIEAIKTETQKQIHRTCETTYVPLKERTKTLSDLKKDDSTENREKAAPYIKRYETRRKRILDKRVD